MSLYTLQKLMREFNRNNTVRERFNAEPSAIGTEWGLTAEETAAMAERDYRRLYALGVHGLLLRPFSILHGVSEPDYLEQIRGAGR